MLVFLLTFLTLSILRFNQSWRTHYLYEIMLAMQGISWNQSNDNAIVTSDTSLRMRQIKQPTTIYTISHSHKNDL